MENFVYGWENEWIWMNVVTQNYGKFGGKFILIPCSYLPSKHR